MEKDEQDKQPSINQPESTDEPKGSGLGKGLKLSLGNGPQTQPPAEASNPSDVGNNPSPAPAGPAGPPKAGPAGRPPPAFGKPGMPPPRPAGPPKHLPPPNLPKPTAPQAEGEGQSQPTAAPQTSKSASAGGIALDAIAAGAAITFAVLLYLKL